MIIRQNTFYGCIFFVLRCLTFQVDTMILSTCHNVFPCSCGIHIHQICLHINTSLFAADQVLIANSKNYLRRNAYQRSKICKLRNLKVSVSESK